MQLFGGNASFNGKRKNFNTMWTSVLVMFDGLTATTYTETMWAAMDGVGWPAALYFIAWMIVGNIGLLNLVSRRLSAPRPRQPRRAALVDFRIWFQSLTYSCKISYLARPPSAQT